MARITRLTGQGMWEREEPLAAELAEELAAIAAQLRQLAGLLAVRALAQGLELVWEREWGATFKELIANVTGMNL